jgi:hypothetical protein
LNPSGRWTDVDTIEEKGINLDERGQDYGGYAAIALKKPVRVKMKKAPILGP